MDRFIQKEGDVVPLRPRPLHPWIEEGEIEADPAARW